MSPPPPFRVISLNLSRVHTHTHTRSYGAKRGVLDGLGGGDGGLNHSRIKKPGGASARTRMESRRRSQSCKRP